MKVYILYIDCMLRGVYSEPKLEEAEKILKRKLKTKHAHKEDNWIDSYEVIE